MVVVPFRSWNLESTGLSQSSILRLLAWKGFVRKSGRCLYWRGSRCRGSYWKIWPPLLWSDRGLGGVVPGWYPCIVPRILRRGTHWRNCVRNEVVWTVLTCKFWCRWYPLVPAKSRFWLHFPRKSWVLDPSLLFSPSTGCSLWGSSTRLLLLKLGVLVRTFCQLLIECLF